MVWPFLTIYIRQQLEVPLTTVALLLTINSVAAMIASFIAGPAVDRFGRKVAMVIGLGMSSFVFIGMSMATNLGMWAILISVSGAIDPLYNVGANAMVADLVEPERRASAYALLRMVANAGVAVGPMIGGFVISISYSWAFYAAALADVLFTLLILLFVAETISRSPESDEIARGGGYRHIFRDRSFMIFCGTYTFSTMSYAIMMVLLPVYAKENYGVVEQQYGIIMATNAAMVVLFQYSITRFSERYHHLPVLAIGSLFYAIGVGSVAWGTGFIGFLISMVILTIGEMIMVPTSTALAANLAPADMRGRYMGFYGLTWGVGFGTGPVIGGLLNDHLEPVMIWYGGLVLGCLAAVGFLILMRLVASQNADPDSSLS
jgi:MFS family permease